MLIKVSENLAEASANVVDIKIDVDFHSLLAIIHFVVIDEYLVKNSFRVPCAIYRWQWRDIIYRNVFCIHAERQTCDQAKHYKIFHDSEILVVYDLLPICCKVWLPSPWSPPGGIFEKKFQEKLPEASGE